MNPLVKAGFAAAFLALVSTDASPHYYSDMETLILKIIDSPRIAGAGLNDYILNVFAKQLLTKKIIVIMAVSGQV